MFQPRAHAVEEAHQRARPLGEFEAIEDLVARAAGAWPPTRWRTCSFAISLSERSSASIRRRLQLGEQLARSRCRLRDLDADEQVRDLRIGVAVVEFGDVALAEQRAELAEAAGPLGNRHREDRLARLAQLGALGDEAQPVEVHVRAAGDRRRSVRSLVRCARTHALTPAIGERARRLEDRARVLEHVLDRGADRVGVDAHHLVDVLAREAERLLADLLDRDAVGEQARRAAAPTRRPASSERAIASESTAARR